ncbi:MAG: hypothetical protein ACR2PH_16405 [Desulfobulbia bacterium]
MTATDAILIGGNDTFGERFRRETNMIKIAREQTVDLLDGVRVENVIWARNLSSYYSRWIR